LSAPRVRDTGHTSWATEEALADARMRLEQHPVDVIGLGRTSEHGDERIETKFTLEADTDRSAESRAKTTSVTCSATAMAGV
jgi:hypothetical protein